MPSLIANSSMADSSAKYAWGAPGARYASTGVLLVATSYPVSSKLGIRYVPPRNEPVIPACQPLLAPLSKWYRARSATSFPSRLAPSSRSKTAAGAGCATANSCCRVSVRRSGRPVRRASRASSVSSSETLPPKPPPTGIGTTRTFCAGTSRSLEISSRTWNGPCVGAQMVIPPSGSGRAIETCGSIGEWWTPARRYVSLMTTSAPASAGSTWPRFRLATAVTFGGRGALLHGGPCVDAGRERLEVDLDQRRPVDGRGLARRDDGSHRLARIEHAADRQRLVLPGGAGQRQVSPGEHREHARRRSRGAGLDAADPGAGQVAQDQLDVKQARHVEVGREPGRSGDLFAAFQPPPAHPDHAHRPIMACPPNRAPGRQAPGTLRELDPGGV